MTRSRSIHLAGAALGALLAAGSASAQTAHGSAIWSPAPGSGDWNTGTNWVPAAAPNGASDTATFDVSTNTNVSLSQNTTVSGITFDATAVNGYTVTAAPGTMLTISGAGVTNNSGSVQNFVTATNSMGGGVIIFSNSAVAGNSSSIVITNDAAVGPSNTCATGSAVVCSFNGGYGSTQFTGSSSAGSVTINNLGGAVGDGGGLSFYDHSMAGSATINLAPAGFDNEDASGVAQFNDSSNAGTAHITVGGGSNVGPSAALTFLDSSSAGSSTIIVQKSTYGGMEYNGLEFRGTATGANATIINQGGQVVFDTGSTAGNATIQGSLIIIDQADGGTAHLTMGSADTLDVSGDYNTDLTAGSGFVGDETFTDTGRLVNLGSLAGAGTVFLGHSGLVVGGDNRSTAFAGAIGDGGPNDYNDGTTTDAYGDVSVGTPGLDSITKVGAGTLTLSGASTYTGPTLVNAGTLSVTGSLVSAVTVNSGGTLTNSGTIGGLTLASGGTLASTGTPTTMTVNGAGAFASGSTLDFDITPAGANDALVASGAVSLGGATLDILAAPGAYAPGQSYTLLTANGGLSGAFNFGGVTGGAYATAPTLTYTANSVLLNFAALVAPMYGSDIWKAVPPSGDWNTGANWVSGVVPNGSTDTATFDKTNISSVSLSQSIEVNSIVFNPGAGANPYTITAAPGTTLTISGAGVVNNSGVTQNFVAATNPNGAGSIVFGGGGAASLQITNAGGSAQSFGQSTAGASTEFNGSANAGGSTIYNRAGQQVSNAAVLGNSLFNLGGYTSFNSSSSAGNAVIYADSASKPGFTSNAGGGAVLFGDNASAGTASITVAGNGNNNFGADFTDQGSAQFFNNATAANANFTVNGGVVVFNDTSTAGSATVNVSSGGVFFGDQSTGGSARIILSGTSATLDVSNAFVTSGASNTLSSSSVAIGSLEGNGVVDLGGNDPTSPGNGGVTNGLVVGTNNLTTQFAGVIQDSCANGCLYGGSGSNSFAIEKVGTGSLTLSGASTYTGATLVNAGTLSVTGSLVSAVTVNSGATLTVSGKVGGVTLAQGSALTTLGTPQTMTVTGAATFAAGSTVRLAITPAGANDELAVGGAAQLGGATLQVTSSPGAYGTQRYTLLTAAGGVNGTFAFGGIDTGSFLVSPSLIYSPDSVVLAFQRTQITGQTFNERAVAGALNADALKAPFLLALTANGLPTNAQLDQASGEIHATVRSALFDDGALLRDATFDRLLGTTPGDGHRGLELWGDVRGAHTTLDSDGNAAQAIDDGRAIVFGADYGLGRWRVGGAYSNNWGRTSAPDRQSRAKWDGDSLEVYTGGALGPVALNGGASETWYRISTVRSPYVPGDGSASDDGRYHASLSQLYGEAAIGAGLGFVHGQLFERLSGERLSTDGFSESGDATALTGARRADEIGWSLAGLRGNVPVSSAISFQASAGWSHLLGRATPSALLAESSGTDFEVLGAPLARDGAQVSAALSVGVGPMVNLRLGYTGDYAGGNTQHTISLEAVARF